MSDNTTQMARSTMSAERKFRKLLYGTIALLCLNFFLIAFVFHHSSQAQNFSRAKYMYKVVKTAGDEQSLQTVVDLFARDGWELVTHSGDFLIFKK
jgi:hypothetical protein